MWRKASYLRSASFAAISTLAVILGCALLGATGTRAATCSQDPSGCDPFVVTFQQEGSNIVATGTGEFDTAGLTSTGFGLVNRAQIAPVTGQFLFGPASGVPTFNVSAGPTSTRFSGVVGTTPITVPSSTSGLGVGVNGAISNPSVTIPASYMSGTVITSEAVLPVASISCATPGANPCDGLGMQPDQVFTWTWGSNPDQSFTINSTLLAPTPEIPLPAAFPLFASGLGALGLLGWRRKRKSTASLLAA
jgi:hypothetical protein